MAPPKEEKPALSTDLLVQISSSSSSDRQTPPRHGYSPHDAAASPPGMARTKKQGTAPPPPPPKRPRLDLLAVDDDFPAVPDGESADLVSFNSDEAYERNGNRCDAAGDGNEGDEEDDDEEEEEEEEEEEDDDELPEDFLEPLDSPIAGSPAEERGASNSDGQSTMKGMAARILRQFWKSGKYDDALDGEEGEESGRDFGGSMERVRVHPKFLHSNATSHKWALGAIAELLDNSLDEAVHGATVVKLDMVRGPRDGRPMLVIEDDGGGMDPEQIRRCMSLGYSIKSKLSCAIGQYGNGFKTSTMRLGADVLVLTRSGAKGKHDGSSSSSSLPTQSIGLLSYTFLTSTGQDDITVPMVDYEIQPFGLRKLLRGSLEDWNHNLEMVLRWSPYRTERELLDHLTRIHAQGTIVIVYNLWEDEQGDLELDFDADPHDIQLRGTNRNERSFWMASRYPSCKHYFTYKYSLRSYASILYLRLPKRFKIVLRGEPVAHHRLVDDLMFPENLRYRPHMRPEITQKDSFAIVTLGFVKDAREHIDVQGFNVYHKNRLIRPFWRVWINPGCKGRGIVGVLEANYIEPAHDKQGFERTILFGRLETRLLQMQKRYWLKNCTRAGYVGSGSKRRTRSRPVQDSPGTRLPQYQAMPPISTLPASASSMQSGGPKLQPLHQAASFSLQPTSGFLNAAASCNRSSIRETPSSKPQTYYPSASLARMNRMHESNIMTVIETLSTPEGATHGDIPELLTGKERVDQEGRNSALVPKPGTDSLPCTRLKVAPLSMKQTEPRNGSLSNPITDSAAITDEVSSKLSAASSLTTTNFPCLLEHEDQQDSLPAPSMMERTCSSAQPFHISSKQGLAGDTNGICTSPLQRGDWNLGGAGVNGNGCSRGEASVNKSRGLSQKRSMLQLRQSHARAAMLSSSEGRKAAEKQGGTACVVSGSNTMSPAPGSTGAESLLIQKLEAMKQKAESLHKEVDKVFNERDVLRLELQEERRRQAGLEEELKRKLQSMLLRASQLEAENKLLLQSCYL